MMRIRPFYLKETLLFSGVFCWAILAIPFQALAQLNPSSSPHDGERLDYLITYEWGPFYLSVGDASFTTVQLQYGEITMWSFEGWGASKNHWNWFYPVQSIYSSVAESDFNPRHFQRKGREGSHRYDRWYDLSNTAQVSWTSQDMELQSGSMLLQNDTRVLDLMTAVHWCRTLAVGIVCSW